MVRIALLLLFALVLLPACDKGSPKGPPAIAPETPVVEKAPSIKTPLGVPKELGERVAREWPAIEEQGKLFLAKFQEFSSARAGGDREKMFTAAEAASAHFNQALEGWNGIYYSVEDLPDAQAEKCRRFLRKWNMQVDDWTKKNKALKEFSRAK